MLMGHIQRSPSKNHSTVVQILLILKMIGISLWVRNHLFKFFPKMNEDRCICLDTTANMRSFSSAYAVLSVLRCSNVKYIPTVKQPVCAVYPLSCIVCPSSFQEANLSNPALDICLHLTQIQINLLCKTSYCNCNYSACWSCVGHCAVWSK